MDEELSASVSFAVRLWMDSEDVTALTSELCQAADFYARWSVRAARAWDAYQLDATKKSGWSVCADAKTAAENLMHACAKRLYELKNTPLEVEVQREEGDAA